MSEVKGLAGTDQTSDHPAIHALGEPAITAATAPNAAPGNDPRPTPS